MTKRGVEFPAFLKMDHVNGDYLIHIYCRDGAVQRSNVRSGVTAMRLVKISSGFARLLDPQTPETIDS
ncbi:hypothetical protein GGTG_02249 [Gaeumannomyces tritici R3-111a-1]|uniref:Uncharacterized protein n=1 Tax=Gaeumannomyces tritici (strain R3-111a-1) TaxID=644352 RepID=J3NLU9_GAET3|nr:hypothetical protein GGTG_02249 [Gaeumannomyces tritici R3-111a-1]EJT82275.1 hypothetical protein GGTG_02249 [Gaeumannomyces tritici R3-111a-1]